jgi:biotin transport system substrate-specific component
VKLKNMVFTALFAAAICVISPWSIPIGEVPLSLATFAVYFSGAVLGKKYGTLAVLLYVFIGAVGVPVFAGLTGGVYKIVGVTGGYLIGYIPCAFFTGLFTDRWPRKIFVYPAGMILGTVVCYIFGTVWYMYLTHNPLAAALAMCVVPFLIGDVIKIIAATAVSIPLRTQLDRYILSSTAANA